MLSFYTYSLLQLDEKLKENLQTIAAANQLIANAGQYFANDIAKKINEVRDKRKARIDAKNAAKKALENFEPTNPIVFTTALDNYRVALVEEQKAECARKDSLKKKGASIDPKQEEGLANNLKESLAQLNSLEAAEAACNNRPAKFIENGCGGPCGFDYAVESCLESKAGAVGGYGEVFGGEEVPRSRFSTKGMVDMIKGSAKNLNELGWPRDAKFFWENYTDPYNALSPRNKANILARKFTDITVDEQWIKNMPGEKNAILNESIEHHHMNKGRYAIPLSKTNHRLAGNYRFNHPKIENSTVFKKDGSIMGRTGKTIVGRVLAIAQIYFIFKDIAHAISNDPKSNNNQLIRYKDGTILNEVPPSGYRNGGLYYIYLDDSFIETTNVKIYETKEGKKLYCSMDYTIYENYGKVTGKDEYFGVGVLVSGNLDCNCCF